MCKPGDISMYVLLTGDPKRTALIASRLDNSVKIADYRQFISYRGTYRGVDISIVSTGIGCPAAAITVEELSRIGAKYFIRVGTTGSLQPNIDVGDLVVPLAAVRGDGTTKRIIKQGYPAVASFRMVKAVLKAAEKLNVKTYSGIVWTDDLYYSNNSDLIDYWSKAGVLSVEMECSAIFVLASLKGLEAAAILAVDGGAH